MMIKNCLTTLIFLLVPFIAFADEEADLFVKKLKEYSKQMMPIEFEVDLTSITKPIFNNKEEAIKYEKMKMEEGLKTWRNKPSESEINKHFENNIRVLVEGYKSTMHYNCKSYDCVNYQLYAFDGETNNCVQVILNTEEYECKYAPNRNQLDILPPSSYTREVLFLFEHERAYNFLDKGMRLEKKDNENDLYINENGDLNFLLKFKPDNYRFPDSMVIKADHEHTYIDYCDFNNINGLLFPSKLIYNRNQRHEITNERYLKYVDIYQFSNIKIDPTMKKSDLDIVVSPGVHIFDQTDRGLSRLIKSENPMSLKKEIIKEKI